MNPSSSSAQVDEMAAQKAGERSAPFAAELFGRAVATAAADSNVFISPYSVGTALALTLEGAKGDTAGQLKKAIGYPHDYPLEKLHHDVTSLINAVRIPTDRKIAHPAILPPLHPLSLV
jgi:serine protease inhibitor